MNTPKHIWKTFSKWIDAWGLEKPQRLEQGAIKTHPYFEPPALESDFAKITEETGIPVPQELSELYRIHNGSYCPLLTNGMWLSPCHEIVEDWKVFAELAEEFNAIEEPKPVPAGTHLDCAYHERWLPICSREDLYLLMDFTPGPQGSKGQILLQINECEYKVVANTFLEYLELWIEIVDNGRVRFDPNYGYALAEEMPHQSDLFP